MLLRFFVVVCTSGGGWYEHEMKGNVSLGIPEHSLITLLSLANLTLIEVTPTRYWASIALFLVVEASLVFSC